MSERLTRCGSAACRLGGGSSCFATAWAACPFSTQRRAGARRADRSQAGGIAANMSIPNHPASPPDIPSLRARALNLRRKMMAMASGKAKATSRKASG